MPHAELFNRRHALIWASAAVLAAQLPAARGQTRRRATRAQTEGPFYPVGVFRSLAPADRAAVSAAFVPGADGLTARYALAVGG